MSRARLAGILTLCLLAAAPAVRAAEPGFQPLKLTVRPITSFGVGTQRFGALEYRGGLQLISANPAFGAFSGLDFGPDGSTLYAISDTGNWLTGHIVESDGRLVGLEDAAFAPVLDAKGQPFTSKITADAEGLRIVTDNGRVTALVSFEQKAAISRYVADPDLALARRQAVPLPKFVNHIRGNRGLEGLAVAPATSLLAGSVVALAERSLDSAGNHRGFILSGPRAGTFSIKRLGEFDITDAAFLPDGDLLLLERRFDYSTGVGMQIRRIPGASIRPGATVDGEVLMTADMLNQIDNMEGMAVRTAASGETIITLISDDNLNRLLQRTILLQFALPPRLPPLPILRPG